VVDRPATPDRPDPIFALGFTIDEHTARRALRRFIHRKRLAPPALKRRAFHRLEGVYLPSYLYSAVAESSYDAVIGEDYTTVVFDGKKVRTKRKTERRSLSGRFSGYVSDAVVTASATLSNHEVESLEPFELSALRRFSAALVSGWIAEEPSLDRETSLELARSECRAAMTAKLRRFMPGDSCLDLRHKTVFSNETTDLTLLPVWIAAVRHGDDKLVRLLVNGQTGRVSGRIPVSWSKLGFLVAAIAGLVAVVTIILGSLV
jgi:hypothetical protein